MRKLNWYVLTKNEAELASEADALCLVIRHTENEIRDKYRDRLPTSKRRIRNFVAKHFTKLRNRDPIFLQYVSLCSRLDYIINTLITEHQVK